MRGDVVFTMYYARYDGFTGDRWYLAGIFETREAALARARRDGQDSEAIDICQSVIQ